MTPQSAQSVAFAAGQLAARAGVLSFAPFRVPSLALSLPPSLARSFCATTRSFTGGREDVAPECWGGAFSITDGAAVSPRDVGSQPISAATPAAQNTVTAIAATVMTTRLELFDAPDLSVSVFMITPR